MSMKSCLLLAALLLAPAVEAASLNPPPAPAIGSRNIATADLLVSRPSTTPCKLTLFSNQTFADFSAKPFSYTPPTACPGPWAKVVFEGDFSVSAGVQYDRTAQIFIGGVSVYYGTTSEPTSSLSPSWHVERDLTDYSALFNTAQSGYAFIGNIVNSTYTGVISGSADLAFYPADAQNPAPTVPAVVTSINGDGAVTLSNGSSQVSRTLSLPTNIEQVWLDVIAQSQSGDEFWYTCVPDDVSQQLNSCGGTAFREVEVSVDGQPAGVAPVYPWIYTGGLNPRLWLPIPGVQTLNFLPYRVDLTPFAGVLSNGQPHTIAFSVYNADNYFLATGTLLLALDTGATQVTGAVTSNTLTAPSPQITENLKTGPGGVVVNGTVQVGSSRSFTIAGCVNTSHGQVTTQLDQSIAFSSLQRFQIGSGYEQNIQQTSTVNASRKVSTSAGTSVSKLSLSYPLNVDYTIAATTIGQQYLANQSLQAADGSSSSNSLSNSVNAYATLATQATTSQRYIYRDSTSACYDRTISATLGVVTSVVDRCGN